MLQCATHSLEESLSAIAKHGVIVLVASHHKSVESSSRCIVGSDCEECEVPSWNHPGTTGGIVLATVSTYGVLYLLTLTIVIGSE